MRVIAMYRVSTERQQELGASLDAQQRIYRDLAAKNAWNTVGEFRGCESATQAATERRVLQEVLEAIRDLRPDALYVHEQSRLTRGDELEAAVLMRELREQRVKILIGGVVRDLSSIDERFMLHIQSAVDRAESERIKERAMRGKREKARQGKHTSGAAPFGYRNPFPGDPERGTLQVVPEEAAIVRRAFELGASGASIKAAVRQLNAEGLRSASGGRWASSSLRRVLAHPVYIGVSASNVWVRKPGPSKQFKFDLNNPEAVLIEGAHEAIVARELWERVQARPRVPRTDAPTLLTGLLWVNDARSGGDSNHGRPFYRAATRQSKLPWLARDYTESTVWQAFASVVTKPAILADIVRQIEAGRSEASTESTRERLEALLAKHSKRLTALIDMRSDGEIDKDQFQQRSDECKRVIADSQKQLSSLAVRQEHVDPKRLEMAIGAARSLVTGVSRLTKEQQRGVLRSIVRRIDVRATRKPSERRRDRNGAFAPGAGGRTWNIEQVTFSLAIPGDAGAPRTQNSAGNSRDRHLDTTSAGCARRRRR